MLGSAAHYALVQHATCLEHGELIHVSEAEAEAHAQPPRLADSFADVRITRTSQAATPAHGAEAHCSHTLLRREGLMPAAWYLISAEPEAQSSPVLPLEQLHPEPVARLRLAPKSSPPLS
ncbi:MAG: hypothetical protein JXB05_07810 [Myxococcaceae bacterium]|nr:hypothetical protein [Myxococcaceae bacterium]